MADLDFDKQVAALMAELGNLGNRIEAEADEVVSKFIDDTFIPALKAASPSSDTAGGSAGKNNKNKGKYRDGWVKKKDSKRKYYRVSNKNRPDLTYMLENGFERTYTNKTTGKPTKIYHAGPQQHIRPMVRNTEQILINRLKNKLGGN